MILGMVVGNVPGSAQSDRRGGSDGAPCQGRGERRHSLGGSGMCVGDTPPATSKNVHHTRCHRQADAAVVVRQTGEVGGDLFVARD